MNKMFYSFKDGVVFFVVMFLMILLASCAFFMTDIMEDISFDSKNKLSIKEFNEENAGYKVTARINQFNEVKEVDVYYYSVEDGIITVQASDGNVYIGDDNNVVIIKEQILE